MIIRPNIYAQICRATFKTPTRPAGVFLSPDLTYIHTYMLNQVYSCIKYKLYYCNTANNYA